jgi:hypothetical protein
MPKENDLEGAQDQGGWRPGGQKGLVLHLRNFNARDGRLSLRGIR